MIFREISCFFKRLVHFFKSKIGLSRKINELISQRNKMHKETSRLKLSYEKSYAERRILVDKIASLERAQKIITKQKEELELQRKFVEEQKMSLQKANDKFRHRTIELFGKMIDLKKAKKTISQQNELLAKNQTEIENQQKKLEKFYNRFRERTIELFGKMIDLKKAKKTISRQNDELEKHQAKLHELNASKDKFFSIISHDLRNPIAGFLNLTEVMSENYDLLSEKESKEFVELLNQSSKQLYNLLENLLQWSRAQTGRIEYEPKMLNLNAIVEDNIDLMMMNLENKHLKVRMEIDPETMIWADENMITTVIRNLLSNAIKFSRKEGMIFIRAKMNESETLVAVDDFGVGIKPETQSKLFQIDKQQSTFGTSNEKGTGLGLILCKEFVEKHGGKIWVESEVNKGSSFKFTLPVHFG